MLSDKEKREMLVDAKSKIRRDNFRAMRNSKTDTISFDDYLLFLDGIQKIFKPFEISRSITFTGLNKF